MILKRCNGALITPIINISSLRQQGPHQEWPHLDLELRLTTCGWNTESQLLEVPLMVEILITSVERSRHWRKTSYSFPLIYNTTATYHWLSSASWICPPIHFRPIYPIFPFISSISSVVAYSVLLCRLLLLWLFSILNSLYNVLVMKGSHMWHLTIGLVREFRVTCCGHAIITGLHISRVYLELCRAVSCRIRLVSRFHCKCFHALHTTEFSSVHNH